MNGTVTPEPSPVLVSGPDATEFLHAQLCGDLHGVKDGESCLTAWCSPAGRVLTTVLAARAGGDWILVLPGDLSGPMLKRLGMFVLRARVTLARGAQSDLLQLERTGALAPLPAPGTPWTIDHVQRRVPWIAAATSDRFLPQELGLEAWRGLSFDKGCYPGQEIVARMHFRGTLKRGPAQLSVPAGTACASAGTRIEDADGKHLGDVLYGAAVSQDREALLAILDHAAAGTALYCGAGRVPVSR